MNILFGEVTGEYLNSCLDNESKMFEMNGRYYDYCIEMNPECFVIHDTIGRKVPIDITQFEELYRAAKIAKNYSKALSKYMHVSDLVSDSETLVVCD